MNKKIEKNEEIIIPTEEITDDKQFLALLPLKNVVLLPKSILIDRD